MKPEDFYVVSRASQGVHVDLVDPAGNREWARIRSTVSAEFRKASKKALVDAAKDGATTCDDPLARKQALRLRRAELAAALIAAWSLPESINPVELMTINPRLRKQFEQIADDHSMHFGVST